LWFYSLKWQRLELNDGVFLGRLLAVRKTAVLQRDGCEKSDYILSILWNNVFRLLVPLKPLSPLMNSFVDIVSDMLARNVEENADLFISYSKSYAVN